MLLALFSLTGEAGHEVFGLLRFLIMVEGILLPSSVKTTGFSFTSILEF